MPAPKRKIVLEWGAAEHRNVFQASLARKIQESRQSGKQSFDMKGRHFVLMNKRPLTPTFRAGLDYLAGSRTRKGTASLLQADFLKNSLRNSSVDELHAHFVFSAPVLGKNNEVLSEKNFFVKRHADIRKKILGVKKKPNLRLAKIMLQEAGRVLKKGGRLIVSDSEVYLPIKILERLALKNGLRLYRISYELKEIEEHSVVPQEFRMHDHTEHLAKSYLAEFEKQ